jgi:hypothetical protein
MSARVGWAGGAQTLKEEKKMMNQEALFNELARMSVWDGPEGFRTLRDNEYPMDDTEWECLGRYGDLEYALDYPGLNAYLDEDEDYQEFLSLRGC